MILKMWMKVGENGRVKVSENHRLRWSVDPENSDFGNCPVGSS